MVADQPLATLWAALASGAIGGSPGDLLRAVVVVVVVLAPGLVWVRAIFGRRAIPLADHAAFALALSLMGYVLGAFALHGTPWGLQRTTWAGWFLALVASGLVVALRRGAGASILRRPHRPSPGAVFEIAVLIALVGTAYAVARVGAVAQPRPGFTQAWVLPDASVDARVRIGLSSAEAEPTTYRIEARLDGVLVERYEDVTLAPSESWTGQLDLAEGAAGVLEAVVFRRSETVPYRRVTHVLNSEPVPTPPAPRERPGAR